MRGKNIKFPKNIIGKKTQREDISSGLLVNFHGQCKAGHSLRYLDAHLVNPSNFSKNKYSLHTWKKYCFGEWYGLQSLTLTSYFYKNIYHKVIYLYFYESIFKTNLFIWFLYFETQQLKSYLWFMFPMFNPNLIENNILFESTEGVPSQ